MKNRHTPFIALIAALVLSACASKATGDAASQQDPWEGFNRAMFSFNEVVDNVVLKPVTRAYRFIAPEPVREGVHNVVRNLGAPVRIANNLLQGDVDQAFNSFWRFVINSSVGIGGVIDVAANTDLKKREEDFGQTLGAWGADSGPYLVLPIIGPSSARDALGRVGDLAMDPFTWYLDDEAAYAYYGTRVLDGRDQTLDVTDEIYRTSLDPYATIRSAYLQKRQAQVENRAGADEKKY